LAPLPACARDDVWGISCGAASRVLYRGSKVIFNNCLDDIDQPMQYLRINEIGQVGLNTDLNPADLPPNACTLLQHVLAQDGQLRGGLLKFALATLGCEPLFGASHAQPDGQQWMLYSDGVKVYAQKLQDDPLDITPSEGLPSGRVTFASLNTVLFVNHSEGGLFYWDGSGELQPAPGWPETWKCQFIASLRYSLVALNMKEDGVQLPVKLRWSTSAEDGAIPAEWVPTLENSAGDDILGESSGGIVGAARAGDRLYVVKEDGTYEMVWVGQPSVFQTRRLSDIGTSTPRGVTAVRDQLAIMTSNDVLLWSGNAFQSLIDRRVRRLFLEELSTASREQAVLYYHQPTSRLYVGLANSGAGGRLRTALIYHAEENTWSHRILGKAYDFAEIRLGLDLSTATWDAADGTWDAASGVWEANVYRPTFAELVSFEQAAGGGYELALLTDLEVFAPSEAIQPVAGRAQRLGIALGDAQGVADVHDVWLEMSGGNTGVTIRFGGQDTPTGPVTMWSPAFAVNPDVPQHFDPRVSGRYIAWDLAVSPENRGAWRLGSITIGYEMGGAR